MMIRFLSLMLAFLLIGVQEIPRHDKHKDDPDAYCWNPKSSGTQGPKRARDTHAHRCNCHLVCQLGEDGEVVGDQEDGTCELYCTRTRCFCHIEEPCEKH